MIHIITRDTKYQNSFAHIYHVTTSAHITQIYYSNKVNSRWLRFSKREREKKTKKKQKNAHKVHVVVLWNQTIKIMWFQRKIQLEHILLMIYSSRRELLYDIILQIADYCSYSARCWTRWYSTGRCLLSVMIWWKLLYERFWLSSSAGFVVL